MEQADYKQALSIPIHAPYLNVVSIVKRSPSFSKYPVFIKELDQCDIGTEFSLFLKIE